MSDPTGVPSTPRLPFNPQRLQEPAPVRTGGPGKPLVIGCLVALVLAGIGLIAGLYYAGKNYEKIFAMSLEQVHTGVTARLPGDLPAEDRQRLDAAFASARGAVDGLRRNPSEATHLQSLMIELARETSGTGTLTRKQVEDISGILEKIGEIGKTAPAGTPPPG
jgi:hypothetical protein